MGQLDQSPHLGTDGCELRGRQFGSFGVGNGNMADGNGRRWLADAGLAGCLRRRAMAALAAPAVG